MSLEPKPTLENLKRFGKFSHILVRPHIPLADNIISHAIGAKVFLELLKHYNIDPIADADIVTRYFYCDQIMELDQHRNKTCSVSHTQGTLTWNGLEIVALGNFKLSIMSFPINDHYHHERQSVVFSKCLDGIVLKLEMHVAGILDPAERKQRIPSLLKGLEVDAVEVDADADESPTNADADAVDDDADADAEADDETEDEASNIKAKVHDVVSLSFQLVAETESKNDAVLVKEMEILARYCQGDFISS